MSLNDAETVGERIAGLGELSSATAIENRYEQSFLLTRGAIGKHTALDRLAEEAFYYGFVDLGATDRPAIRELISEHGPGYDELSPEEKAGLAETFSHTAWRVLFAGTGGFLAVVRAHVENPPSEKLR